MNATVWRCSNREYHADKTRIGSSMMKVALDSLRDYHDLYVGKDRLGQPLRVQEPTKEMILGSLTHCLVLEPKNLTAEFTCRPDGIDGRTTKGKEDLAKWRASSIGKQEVDSDMMAKAQAMAAAVLNDPVVRELLPGAIIERSILWEENGLQLKCRPDWFWDRFDMDSDLHLDLKTSDDPTPEAWCRGGSWCPMQKYRYDLQVSAHYTAGIERLTGKPCCSGVIVVGKSAPHDVYVYDTTEWREIGEFHRQRAMQWIIAGPTTGWRRPEQAGVTKLVPGKFDYPTGD